MSRQVYRTSIPLALMVTAILISQVIMPVSDEVIQHANATNPDLDAAADLAAPQQQPIDSFLSTYCISCHGPDKPKANLRLDDLVSAEPRATDTKRWQLVLEAIEFSDMPPKKAKPQPTGQERETATAWISDLLEKVGHGEGHDHPHDGNLVHHDSLFSGEHKGPASSPARLWRISPFISSAQYSGGGSLGRAGVKPSQPFSLSDLEGLRDYAKMWRLDGPTLELLLLNASEVVRKMVGPTDEELQRADEAHLADGGNPRKLPSHKLKNRFGVPWRDLAYSEEPTDEQINEAVLMACKMAFSRAPTGEEVARYTELLKNTIKEGGPYEGTLAGLTAILVSPEAIYRMELGLGEADAHGRRMLSPQELGFALSFALRDTPPDHDLQVDIHSGKILDREVIADHVRRMIDLELSGHYQRPQAPRYLRFFQEFFGYTRAPEVFKDGSRFPEHRHLPEYLVSDTDTLIQFILLRDQEVLKELLTTNTVTPTTWGREFRQSYTAYGLNKQQKDEALKRFKESETPLAIELPYAEALDAVADRIRQRRVAAGEKNEKKLIVRISLPDKKHSLIERPEHERAGILTQPSWLTAHSQNFDNDVVKRGKWVYEHLLAGKVPDVPVTVDAAVPADHDKTLRERMVKTTDPYCWSCHKKMDPFGFAFEMYDDVGRFRTEELLRDNKTTVPAKAETMIIDTGLTEIDGEYKDAIELMQALADSDRVRQSFIRHVFRYYMGRNETLDDSPTLIAADKAYLASGGSMKELVVSLLTSDSFLYRK